jgi:2-oxoglutarate ferredoxin oxidoreductase subunit gamma
VRRELRITGYGGQGVILSAYVLGRAATLHQGLHATMTQSFGPEARGSACSAQIVLSDEPIDYPYVRRVDLLVAMSQEGFDLHVGGLADDGVLIVDEDLVELGRHAERPNTFACPATRIAEELGRRIVQNMAMLGFVTAVVDFLDVDAVRQAIESSVPAGTGELNLKAFEGGHAYYRDSAGTGHRGRDRRHTVGA